MTPDSGKRKKSRTPKWLLAVGAIVGVGGIALAILGMKISPIVRQKAIEALEKRYQSRVDLADLTVNLFPRISVSGRGLVLYHRGRTDVPPLVKVRQFRANASLAGLLNQPMHVGDVVLEGMEIHMPPRRGGMPVTAPVSPANTAPPPKNLRLPMLRLSTRTLLKGARF